MLPFATEFPVKRVENNSAFIAEIITWLRGTSYSTILAASAEKELDTDNAHLRSENGEELRIRVLGSDSVADAIGFRHDFPDRDGRLWRTEGVLKRKVTDDEQDLIRLRTQCIAMRAGAHLESPKKPYLIKSLIKGGWGGRDATLVVSDQPVWLEDSEDGLATARAVTLGEATKSLPTIYVSATGDREWLVNRDVIEKLAYDLGGVAHVVVEPSRAFSFSLRDETGGDNAYGGALGLAIPARGIVSRYFIGWQISNIRDLVAAAKTAALSLRGQMPSRGWDWTELQEQALRAQRERDKAKLNQQEIEELYETEICNLKEKIIQLEQEIQDRSDSLKSDAGEGDVFSPILEKIGPEIYPGEMLDRLRYAANTTLLNADQSGLDSRSQAILKRIVDKISPSAALKELKTDIDRATKDPGRVSTQVVSLLGRHGYQQKAEKKHVRLEARKGYDGLTSITLSKTPGDYRGLKNLRNQIEKSLGINKLLF